MSAAKAIAACSEREGHAGYAYDTLDVTSKAFRTWYAGGYETLVKRNPWFWGHLYRVSDRPLLAYQFQTALDYTMCFGVERWIRELSPEWILCTHSLPQPTLAKLRGKYGFKVAVCVTDLHPHSMWLRGSPDRFFVPTRYTQERLAKRYPRSETCTELVGMPVHPAFKPAPSAPETPMILVSSGGIGGGPIPAVVSSLATLPHRIVVVTGRNEALKVELQSLQLPETVEIKGNVPLECMAELMQSASILVSKPGGLTMFESLATGLPMVVFKPLMIPGQEEDNAQFLVESGAGLMEGNLDRLAPICQALIDAPDRLRDMREAALREAKPDAAEQIVRSLLGQGEPRTES